MTYRIGIGKEHNDTFLTLSIFLYDKMLKIVLFNFRLKRPKWYYWSKISCFHYDVFDKFRIKWFFGLTMEKRK